jgi:CheY-like chemotaxis protein/two-component sensor histidine kinase
MALRRQAEAASRAKDEFLTMLSHELRNPLGAISAAVDLMEIAPSDSPTAGEARSIIARQTRHLAHMMTDLLDVGRAMAGKIVLEGQPVNLAEAARRVVQALNLTGDASRHDLQLRLEDAWVQGDPVRLEQVLTNLIANALRYTPGGARIEVTVRRQGDDSVVEVKDNGPGIPAELLPTIFDLFVQGDRTLDRPKGGLGIGLTLVRRLVELHQGTVTAESSGQGSCFTVRLPNAPAPEPVAQARPLPPRRRSVLLIEDNEDVRTALRSKLELDGHSVNIAADGVDGLARLLELRPEVSIVDIGLPGLTGLELARHARAAGYGGRMIALSGYGHQSDVRKAMVAGFDAYLVKPVDRAELLASLRQD